MTPYGKASSFALAHLPGILVALMLVAVCACILTDSSDAASSGTTGNCAWALDDDGVLSITGSGSMADYSEINPAPWGTEITAVVFDDTVDYIGSYAFYNCTSLESVVLPANITYIPAWAFAKCAQLASVDFGTSVTQIDEHAFDSCESLTSVELPDTLVVVGPYAFIECRALEAVTIPASVSEIRWNAFQDCSSLSSLTFNGGSTYIHVAAFAACSSLESVVLPCEVSSIGSYAFTWCVSLSSVIIGEGFTSLADHVFSDCGSISYLRIPAGLTSVGDAAFGGMTFCDPEGNVLEPVAANLAGHEFTGRDGRIVSEHVHTHVILPGVPATKESVGYTEGTMCGVCGIIFSGHDVIEKVPAEAEVTGVGSVDGMVVLTEEGIMAVISDDLSLLVSDEKFDVLIPADVLASIMDGHAGEFLFQSVAVPEEDLSPEQKKAFAGSDLVTFIGASVGAYDVLEFSGEISVSALYSLAPGADVSRMYVAYMDGDSVERIECIYAEGTVMFDAAAPGYYAVMFEPVPGVPEDHTSLIAAVAIIILGVVILSFAILYRRN